MRILVPKLTNFERQLFQGWGLGSGVNLKVADAYNVSGIILKAVVAFKYVSVFDLKAEDDSKYVPGLDLNNLAAS